MIRDRIMYAYSERYLRKSAIRHDDFVLFERLLAGRGYRTILEIGTYRGCSAAELARFCDHVVTIDLKRGRLEVDEPSVDREEFWRSLGVQNIELILVSGDEEKKRVIDALEFDFAFVDGAHDEQSVLFDFSLVKRCGRVLFHDYKPGEPGVVAAVDSIGPVEIHGEFAFWAA